MAEHIVPRNQWLYDDRGMMKWMGWLLSDHSAFMEQAKAAETPTPVTVEMTPDEINRVLQQAWETGQVVQIQLNVLTHDQYVPVITGRVVSFYAGQIYVQQADDRLRSLAVDQIRHVTAPPAIKWWTE